MEKNYDVDYFINLFEPIPEEKWGCGTIFNHCVYYHCSKEYAYDGEKQDAFSDIFNLLDFSNTGGMRVFTAVRINDGNDGRYQQPTAKQRILAALYDIKKLNQGTGTSTERRNEVQSELPKPTPKISISFPKYHQPVSEVLDKELVLK